MHAEFFHCTKVEGDFPPLSYPEIAFLGRSNSGKSSLINELTETKNLARKSQTPGRTQSLNFFRWHYNADENFNLVDLPGFGYNEVAKCERKNWDTLLAEYLGRETIRYFCLLLDVRRDIAGEEQYFIDEVSKRHPVVVVLTKVDKINSKELNQRVKKFRSALGQEIGVFPISNTKKLGIKELREHFRCRSIPS